MAYSDLLKDMRWQRKRLETLGAAGWKCECLGETGEGITLNVHHRRYIPGAKPWEYQPVDLVVLCSECHEDWHDWKRDWTDGKFEEIRSWLAENGLMRPRLQRQLSRFSLFQSGKVSLS